MRRRAVQARRPRWKGVGVWGDSSSNTCSLDGASRRAYFGDTEIELSKLEFDLLAVFLNQPGRVFDRTQLLRRIRGLECVVTERTIDVHSNGLRKKIEQAGGDAQQLETVRGVGYRLREPAE